MNSSNEKTAEYLAYLQEIIAGNEDNPLGRRVVLNTEPNKKLDKIRGVLKLSDDEEIVVFFDDTLTGSGKGGLLLTSWGVRFKDAAVSDKWSLSWEEIAEKYCFHKEGLVYKKLNLRNGRGNDFTSQRLYR